MLKKILFAITLLIPTSVFAGGDGANSHVRIEPSKIALEYNKENRINISFRNPKGDFLIPKDFDVVHTERLHMLIIGQELEDYQHIHPYPDKVGYSFNFTPKESCGYVGWADVTPTKTGKQEYVKFTMGDFCKIEKAPRVYNNTAKIDDLEFALSFDSELKAGSASMGEIVITKDGKPFNQLEPIMGAFGHIVAFSEDLESVLHVHPMGKEPTTPEERGGPELSFHLEPHKKGFVKLFAQVKVGDKQYFAPFGLEVK